MEKDIAEGKMGEVGSYDLEFKGGKLVGKGEVHSPQNSFGLEVKAEVSVSLDGKAVFAAIKKAIPGQVDDVLLGVLEAAILGS